MTHPNPNENDAAVLEQLRVRGPMSVTGLCENLGVTATAIRQRLGRLAAGGLIEREADRRDRGRPVFTYRLTAEGRSAVGENLADLAESLWLEVLAIEDASVRGRVIEGVIQRLTDKYRSQIYGRTLAERLESIAVLFRQRKIPFVVESENSLPVLRIIGCPYPRLNDRGTEICELEQQLFARLLDIPIALQHCQCGSSGGVCCTFSAGNVSAVTRDSGQETDDGVERTNESAATAEFETGRSLA